MGTMLESTWKLRWSRCGMKILPPRQTGARHASFVFILVTQVPHRQKQQAVPSPSTPTVPLCYYSWCRFPRESLLMRWMHPPRAAMIFSCQTNLDRPQTRRESASWPRCHHDAEDDHEQTPGAHGSFRYVCVSHPLPRPFRRNNGD